MAEGIHAGRLPATRHLTNLDLVELANRLFRESPLRGALIVLNRVPDEETEWFLMEQLGNQGINPIGCIREDRDIAKAWLRGAVIKDTIADVDAIVRELEAVAAESDAASSTA